MKHYKKVQEREIKLGNKMYPSINAMNKIVTDLNPYSLLSGSGSPLDIDTRFETNNERADLYLLDRLIHSIQKVEDVSVPNDYGSLPSSPMKKIVSTDPRE